MNCQIVILIFLSLKTVVGKNVRIVGGEVVNIQEFPFLVSLRYVDTYDLRCGGAIISNKHVLTAAHCVSDIRCQDIIVFAGNIRPMNTTGLRYNIKRFKMHPHYKETMETLHKHDIAVITICGIFEFNDVLNKIELPTVNVFGNERVVLLGWGKTSYTYTSNSLVPRKAQMKILKHYECFATLPFLIHEEQLCVFERAGVGACIGDSGGPLISNGKVVGIASFVLPCATGVPDIYTRVFNYLPFIRKELKESYIKLPTCCTCQ